MAKDPAAAAQRWATNLAAATQAITDGVNAVTVAPGAAAARNKAAWVQNTPAAADKWATNTAKVTKEEWQSAMTTKGIPRIGPGAQASQPKMQAFLQTFLPFVDNVVAGLPPRGNLEQNIARSAAFARKVATFRKP